MEEVKCPECGTMVKSGIVECPNCGCPVEHTESTIVKKDDKDRKSISAICKGNKVIYPLISLIIGIVIVILGINVVLHKIEAESYDVKSYDADSAIFGADFYTEIYGASDIIVDELNDINGGISIITDRMDMVTQAIYYGSGMIIIAIGLGVVAVSFIYLGKLLIDYKSRERKES